MNRVLRFFRGFEDGVAGLLLAAISIIPTSAVFVRTFLRSGIFGASEYLVHLVVWIAFVGGMITSREERHLAFAISLERLNERARLWIKTATSLVSVFVATALALASLSFVILGFDPSAHVGVLPTLVVTLIMPVGFAVMSIRFITHASTKPRVRWIVSFGIIVGIAMGLEPLLSVLESLVGFPASLGEILIGRLQPILAIVRLPLIVVLIAAALLGAPIFVLLGGLALLLFYYAGGSLETITNEAYTILTDPVMLAIPLFTVAGFILSESKAGERLVRLFRALFGWMPGGLVIMSIIICAFLTTFTGASGVTILAVGGLLAFILDQAKYQSSFSIGLLTASGSIGLLFPPSLPIILYGVIAQVNIKEMFVGGVLPGLLMVITLIVLGVVQSTRQGIARTPFRPREALASLAPSAGEILLPVVVLLLFFRGVTTLGETGAIAVVYTFILEVVIHRDIGWRQVPDIARKSAPVIGGILLIVAVAKGLSYYIVDAQIPTALAQWLEATVPSRWVFLIFLNLALLVTGCFMDIFSAITVVVPLIVPLGVAYGVNPVHLGIIFLANLELGYLTPPVGLNLYLASYRFDQPLTRIYRSVVPFLLVLLVAVLVITYVPWMTTGLLKVFRF